MYAYMVVLVVAYVCCCVWFWASTSYPFNLIGISRIDLGWGDFDMSLVEALWETKVQFDAARQSTKLDHAPPCSSKKRKHEKTPW